MKHIYLVRHGQDEDNANGILNGRRDLPLTDKGLKQAHEAAQKIKELGIQFDKIYSSPLQRAYQTARIIAETLGFEELEILQDLIEREFGVITGLSTEAYKELKGIELLITPNVTYSLNPQGAETFPQLVERADRLLKYLNQNHPDGNILLVTHGDFGKMIYAAYHHLDWQDVLKQFHFGNSELLELSEESGPKSAHVFTIEQHNI
jgi:broad specificity phosphatase PhoE